MASSVNELVKPLEDGGAATVTFRFDLSSVAQRRLCQTSNSPGVWDSD